MLRKLLRASAVLVLLGAFGLGALYAYLASGNGKRAEKFRVFAEKISRPLVIAHRGGAGLAPENTLEAFKRSHELGVDVLELDVHLTSDGQIVVIHDSTVDRTTNGEGRVDEMPLDEVQKLDAGYRWTSDGGKTFPFRGNGVRIPTLRQVFEKFPDAKINVEAKTSSPSPATGICNLIKEFGRNHRTVVASVSGSVLGEFRSSCRDVATSASAGESTNFLALYKLGLSQNFSANMQALQLPKYVLGMDVATKEFLRAARERNLQLHVWTVNKKEDMKKLIEIGADGIMTDRPDELLKLIDRGR